MNGAKDFGCLQTIQDFDFGVGASNEVIRISNVPNDVSNSEINLILWLILENELGSGAEKVEKVPSRTQTDGGGPPVTQNDDAIDSPTGEDNVDSIFYQEFEQRKASHVPRTRQKSVSQGKARRYAEELLRNCGIKLPFNQLTGAEKREIFEQFSASSELLRGQKFGSVLDLFQALRSQSKLLQEFKIIRKCGSGNFGDVFAVTRLQDSFEKMYAAKRISLTVDSVEELKMTLNESKILKSLNHPNIVQFHKAWLEMDYNPNNADQKQTLGGRHSHYGEEDEEQEPLKFYVLMDYCHQSLKQWIDQIQTKPSLEQVKRIFNDVVQALEFIHAKRILHLDINPANILWSDSTLSEVKVGDFGLAIKGDSFNDKTGSWPYYAPEEVFTNKSDVYSFGVTLLNIAERIVTMNELFQRIENEMYNSEFPFLNQVLPQMLAKNPNARPTSSQLKIMIQ